MNKDSTRIIIDHLLSGRENEFRKELVREMAKRMEEAIEERKSLRSKSILEGTPEQMKADTERELLHVDPTMAKEFFLFDIDYKGHTITVKSLGTGIGKPLISYIDGERFEIFTDKEIAVRESKSAIDRMIKKGIKDIQDLRFTPEKLKQKKEEEERMRKEAEASNQKKT